MPERTTEWKKQFRKFLLRRRGLGVLACLLVALALLLVLILLLVLSLTRPKPVEEVPPPSETPAEEGPVLLVTAGQMAQLRYEDSALGEFRWSLSEEALQELNRVLEEYGILDPEQISQFLAQATVESGAGRYLTEYGTEEYFESRGYTSGTRGAGYLHLTHDYSQMAFATWMMKKYVPELSDIRYVNPAHYGRESVTEAYYEALRLAVNLGLNVSRYTRIVYDKNSPVTTGADYIADVFAWESAAYYWYAAGIGKAFPAQSGVENTDAASKLIGGSNWQSRREAYLAFYPVLSEVSE